MPWTTAYAQRNPSVCTLRANQLTPKSEVTQKSRQNGVLHAAPGSASGSSWFCIRLLLCFRQKQSYHNLWDLPNMGKVQHKDYRHGNAFVQAQLVECLKYLHHTRLINETPTAEQEIGLQPCQLLNSFPKRSHGLNTQNFVNNKKITHGQCPTGT